MNSLIKNRYNYYSIKNPPSIQELEEYYQQKYYQEAKGSYEVEYDEEEVKYFNNKIAEKAFVLDKHLDKSLDRSFIDIGSGEGWSLNFFKKKGFDVLGLDYSVYGCKRFNPDCFQNMIAGDLYKNIDRLIEQKRKFSVVWMLNLLEHVTDPEFLIIKIKQIIDPSGILVIEVPNDFSIIQEYALDKGYIDNQFWVTVPDHLSYFNREGLESLLNFNGWKAVMCLGDYPIDWNLLNPNSNYVKDRSKGKSCYREKIEFENLVHTLSMDKVTKFYSSMCDLGLGRVITGFFTLDGNNI